MIQCKGFVLGIFLLFSSCFASFGQRTCATNEYMELQFIKDPAIKESVENARFTASNWLSEQSISNSKSGKAIITIPIVVHVIYNNTSENISDEQIFSQIDVLNEDYRLLNMDTSNIPSYFKNDAADCEIEFCLAKIDPQGNPSTGITRTQTNVTSFSSTSPKSNSSGGKDAWPKNDYLNFWICDLGSGLLGYATFPGGNPSEDGVVCTYTSIGRPPHNNFGGPFNGGRTATHEIGHWLGLFHTFQGGCAGNSSSNCNSQGDRICDTPPTSNANYGCPSSTKNSCTETPTDKNDMHQNYMDYVNDACMYLFTKGQKDAMISVLNTSRLSLQNSETCTGLKPLDAGIILQSPSDTLCGSDAFIPAVTLNNYGNDTLTSTIINYQLDSGTILNYSWTGSLSSLGSEIIYLPKVIVDIGSHSFKSWSDLPNGNIDNAPENDTSMINFEFESGNSISINIITGDFSQAGLVSWSIKDGLGNTIALNSGYSKNTNNIESVCLSPGCYVFTINDPNTNAIGSFSIMDIWGDTLVYQNDIYDYVMTFCVTLPPYLKIENRLFADDILVYPNPTNGMFKISYSENDIKKVKIFNTMGQEISKDLKIINQPEGIIIDLSIYDTGIYFIEIQSSKESFYKKINLIK